MDKTPTLLLIDDDASVRRLCSRVGTRLGLTMIEAEDGQSGREQFEKHSGTISAVLLDMNLPDISGEVLAGEFAGSTPDVPVIFFTGSAAAEEQQTEDGRMQYYLKKPFTKNSMKTVLEKVGVSTGS